MKKCLVLVLTVTAMSAMASNTRLKSFMFRDAPIEYAMSMLGEAWGRHIVVTDAAKSVRVRTFLQDIDCLGALKAICLGHSLWYREDPGGIVYVQTVEEFTQSGMLTEKKFVEVVTLAYPRAEDIAAAIQEAYRDLVVFTAPDQDDDDEIGDISRALDRMDQLQDRSSVLEGNASSQQSYSSSGRGRSSSRRNLETMRGMENIRRYTDDIERAGKYVEMATRRPGETTVQIGDGNIAGRAQTDFAPTVVTPSVVFVSIVRRSNSIVLRSADREMISQIKETIAALDVPKAQVLLEMRILRLDVSDEQDREIGFLLTGDSHTYGSADAGFSSGQGLSNGRLAFGGAADVAGATVFQIMNKHYQARLNLLDSRGKVRSLATPSLLVADFEASRVFIGEELSILTDMTEEQSVSGGDNPVVTKTQNPTIQRRDVGTALVITPKVHADGTVTLRVMQEYAQKGARSEDDTLSWGDGQTITTMPIKKQIITTSVVAKDGETIALGGLMQHDEADTLHKIPLLGDIPWLGALFRFTTHDVEDHELMVLVRPTIIEKPAAASGASRNFLRDNMRDKINLHEAMDATRTNRAERAESILAEPDPAGTSAIIDRELDFNWIPGTGRE